jgi:excisionase family DNA binding protein
LVQNGSFTLKEARDFSKLSISTLYALMGRGELAFIKIGRSRRIPVNALVELAAKNLIGGRDA